jgi:UDP-N-acetylmuramate dehydrogenase
LLAVKTDADVRWALQARASEPLLVLGGGSNVLMHQDWEGRLLHMQVKGVQKVVDDGDAVEVVVGAGESWHSWVMHALEQGWNGLENLSLIPGSVGASPMQNIGAYGVEVKDRFAWLEAIHRETGALERFDAERCAFGYRDSIFKQAERDRWVIVRVAFQLARTAPLNTQYGAIRTELEARNWDIGTTHLQVAEAVMHIRRSKLPDPATLGNAGSFFKNPVVSADAFEHVQASNPEIVHYPAPDGQVKLAAGWLIERAGWKGHRRGSCGVHDRQALVLVNHGGATGAEVWALAQAIMDDVEMKFGVRLEPEVNQIGL